MKKISVHLNGQSPVEHGQPGFTDSTAEYLFRLSRQMCEDSRTYWMGRVVDDPSFCNGECFVVEPFTDEQGRRAYRTDSAPMKMHG